MFADPAGSERVAAADPDAAAPRRTPFPDWVPFTAMLVVVGGLAYRAAGPVKDPDTWWHLRLGEEFRGGWSLSEPGALTPFATRPWFATQWTLEVLASHAEQAFGLAGVSWLAGLGVVLLGLSVYVSCRQRGAVAASSIATSLCLLGSSLSLGPRPQMASFILVAVSTTAWLRTMEDLKPRWWLVPLSWLWACTHGMWFLGVAIGGLAIVGLLLDDRVDRTTAARLSLVPLLSVVAAAVTPVGPKLVSAPLATSTMAQFVSEWRTPSFTEYVPALVLLMISLVVATWARGPRRPWSEILMLGMAVGWVLLSYRTIAVGAVIAAPLVAGSIQAWLPQDRLRAPGWESIAGLAAAGTMVLGLAVSPRASEPVALEGLDQISARLSTLPEGTVVLNDYGLGGWLEWKHRNIAPTVDGLTDAYEVSYMASYVKAARLEPGWLGFVNGTNAQYALLESGTRLAEALAERPEWRPLVNEGNYLLLMRTPT